jgi:hypothetical protein
VKEKKLLYRYDSTKKAATNVDKDKKKIRVEYTKQFEIRLSKRRHAKQNEFNCLLHIFSPFFIYRFSSASARIAMFISNYSTNFKIKIVRKSDGQRLRGQLMILTSVLFN